MEEEEESPELQLVTLSPSEPPPLPPRPPPLNPPPPLQIGGEPPGHRHPPVLYAIAGYCSVSLLWILLDEIVPIFASAPRDAGGLGLTPQQLAPGMAFSGLVSHGGVMRKALAL